MFATFTFNSDRTVLVHLSASGWNGGVTGHARSGKPFKQVTLSSAETNQTHLTFSALKYLPDLNGSNCDMMVSWKTPQGHKYNTFSYVTCSFVVKQSSV